jgi:hypothetical protein
MIETTDLINSGEQVESLGEAWTFTHVTPGIKGAFSRWAKMRARAEKKEQLENKIITREEYAAEMETLGDRMAAGAFNWGSELGNNDMGDGLLALLQGGPGLCRMMQLLLEPTHGPVDGKKIGAMLKEAQQFKEANGVNHPLIEAYNRAIRDVVPNADGAASAKTTAPTTGSKTTNGTGTAAA